MTNYPFGVTIRDDLDVPPSETRYEGHGYLLCFTGPSQTVINMHGTVDCRALAKFIVREQEGIDIKGAVLSEMWNEAHGWRFGNERKPTKPAGAPSLHDILSNIVDDDYDDEEDDDED